MLLAVVHAVDPSRGTPGQAAEDIVGLVTAVLVLGFFFVWSRRR